MRKGRLHSPTNKRIFLYIAVIVAISTISISFIIILIPFPQQPIIKTPTDNNGVTKIYETKGGESYLELQGEKGGTAEMMYIRIDKMKEKGQTQIKYESAREIDSSKKLT